MRSGASAQAERLLDVLEGAAPGREVAGPSGLVDRQGLAGVAGDRLHQAALVAALRHPEGDLAPPLVAQPGRDGRCVVGLSRQQHLARDGVGALAVVDLDEEPPEQLGQLRVVDPVGHPAALAPDPTAAHVEHLDGDLQRVLGDRDHVGVGAVGEHDGVLLHRLGERADVVAQPGGELELELVGGLVHLPLEALDVHPGLAGDERAEVLDDVPVLLRADPADARRRALADVAEQARAADLGAALEDAGRAGAHREHPEQQVDRLADGPGMGVGTEVAHALALRPATHHHPGELLVERHGQPRVGLVVAVLDVEARVVLLDPGVLQLQRLDLGLDDGPLDRGRGRDHPGGALVQVRDVLEVRRHPGPQALGLADVDDPTARVAEPVDPRRVRDRPRGRAVRRRVRHLPSVARHLDTP